jgi:hypothetical protein
MPSTISIKEYFAAEGSRFSHKEAKIIGPAIDALSQQGAVTPRDVVDSARSTNSPLHPFFEWNDQKAADLFRVEQARNMLRSIKVKFVDGSTEIVARAFQVEATKAYEGAPREYRSFRSMADDSAFAARMMQSAYDDLISWRRKYSPYEDVWANFSNTFRQVANQIGECADEVRPSEAPEKTDDALVALIAWKDKFGEIADLWDSWRDQMRFIMEAINEAEKKFCRDTAPRLRPCMSCRRDFVSYGAGNRLCEACSKSSAVEDLELTHL